MTKTKMNWKDTDIIASERALRRAARRALELRLRTSTPVYVMENGKIVHLTKQTRRKPRRKTNYVGWARLLPFGNMVSIWYLFPSRSNETFWE